MKLIIDLKNRDNKSNRGNIIYSMAIKDTRTQKPKENHIPKLFRNSRSLILDNTSSLRNVIIAHGIIKTIAKRVINATAALNFFRKSSISLSPYHHPLYWN
jgi:hypothetical protein